MTLITHIRHLVREDRGAASIEYALVMLFIVLVLVFALATGIGGLLGPVTSEISSSLP